MSNLSFIILKLGIIVRNLLFKKGNSKSNVHDKKVLYLLAVLEALLSYHTHLNRKYCNYLYKIFKKQALCNYKR